MKHIKYADKTLLVGDDAADTIVEYPTVHANAEAADNIDLDGYGSDGQDITSSFVLNSGTVLMAETTHLSIPERDNSAAVAHMRERIAEILTPNLVLPEERTAIADYDFAQATADDFSDQSHDS